MTSTKLVGSPLSSLIIQWAIQPKPSRRNYGILLECTSRLQTRIEAVELVENPHIYRRAGLRTPEENSKRDFVGGAAWMVKVVELGVQTGCKVIFIQTQNQNGRPLLPHPLASRLDMIDVSENPWGWDEESEEKVTLHHLGQLYQTIQQKASSHAEPVMLVWQSLSPLFRVHGFSRSLSFLKSFDRMSTSFLQVWATRTETLSPDQMSELEDHSQALLYLTGGEMTLIRQGIRERGNILRAALPFDLFAVENPSDSPLSFRINDLRPGEAETAKSTEKKSSVPSDQTNTDEEQGQVSKARNRQKIQLRIEEEDEFRQQQVTNAQAARPHIYLEDDDPEFDDMDEEDPDDDLDI